MKKYINIDFSPFHGHLKCVHILTMSMIVGSKSIHVDLNVINLYLKKIESLIKINTVYS